VVRVERRDLTSTLEVASEFLPFQEIEVYAKVSGYIKKMYIDWGTHVKQGQLLAVLEIPELQQQLQQDEASVKHSEQEVGRAHEELTRAESSYNVTHLTYTRLADVQKSRPELVAQQEIDVAQGKDLEANAGVSAAKDALAAAEQGLLASKAALGKDQAADHGAVRWSGDRDRGLHRSAVAGRNGFEQRRSGAVPAFAE
jgi:multidrug resistance efflux pump